MERRRTEDRDPWFLRADDGPLLDVETGRTATEADLPTEDELDEP